MGIRRFYPRVDSRNSRFQSFPANHRNPTRYDEPRTRHIRDFITCWQAVDGSERGNMQQFLNALIKAHGLPKPEIQERMVALYQTRAAEGENGHSVCCARSIKHR